MILSLVRIVKPVHLQLFVKIQPPKSCQTTLPAFGEIATAGKDAPSMDAMLLKPPCKDAIVTNRVQCKSTNLLRKKFAATVPTNEDHGCNLHGPY